MEIETLKGSEMMEWLTGAGSALVTAASVSRFPLSIRCLDNMAWRLQSKPCPARARCGSSSSSTLAQKVRQNTLILSAF